MFTDHRSKSLALVAIVLGILTMIAISSIPVRAQGEDPPIDPTPTPEGGSQPLQLFQQSATPSVDLGRGIDRATFKAYIFDSSDLIDPLGPVEYSDPIDFNLPCFGEVYPYEGCKLFPLLAEGGNWSVRWTGVLVVPEDGEYTFSVPFPDDGVRVFIDGKEIVESGWRYPSPDLNPSPQSTNLDSGFHDLVIEYEQRVPYAAALRFLWSGPSFGEEVVPLTDAGIAKISAIEFTQAIQELQGLQELKDDLAGDREPPIPMVALKPAVVRVYFEPVASTVEFNVRVVILGHLAETKRVTLVPGCNTSDQRLGLSNCGSVDFFFVPPEGAWTTTVETTTIEGSMIEEHSLPLSSRSVEAMVNVPVKVCVLSLFSGENCLEPDTLGDYIPYLRAGLPTHQVRIVGPPRTVRVPEVAGDPWWIALLAFINGQWTLDGADLGRYYQGLVPSDAPAPNVYGIGGGRGAGTRIHPLLEEMQVRIAHESGHMLGRTHPPVVEPSAGGRCWQAGPLLDDSWPTEYEDNRIQEVGFNLLTGLPLDPEDTMDWMSYCHRPRWVSPYTYGKLVEFFEQPTFLPESFGFGQFWQVSGRFDSQGALEGTYPVFEVSAEGHLGIGDGDYLIEVLDQSGSTLFTRFFSPDAFGTFSTDEGFHFGLFSEMVPHQDGAVSIHLLDASGTELQSWDLTGAPPYLIVDAELPEDTPVVGKHVLQWFVDDPDSSEHTFRVEYIPDGSTVHILSWDTTETSLAVDFDDLPGCGLEECLIRVSASDGAKTATDFVSFFEVPLKAPLAAVTHPESGSIYSTGEIVWLHSLISDAEDGYLTGDSVEWTSDIDGILGTGDDLAVTSLSEGVHEVTTTGTDSHGNSASDSLILTVDGSPPTLDFDVLLDGPPVNCALVTIDADDGPGGGLSEVEYSLDRGGNWMSVPIEDLPFSHVVPGEGVIHLVARALDHAGNLSADDRLIYIDDPCQDPNLPPSAEANGPYTALEGSEITLDGSTSQDPEGGVLEYRWDYEGDGVFDTPYSIQPTSTTVFLDDFSGESILQVRDTGSLTDTDSATVTVENVAPSVDAGPDFEVDVGELIQFNGTFTDPGSSDTHTIEWDFGDGNTTSGSLTPEHEFQRPGTFTVRLTVEDDDGGVGFSELIAEVVSTSMFSTSDFVVLGKEGVYLKQNSSVLSGDVGADEASDGPYLTGSHEVTVGIGVDVLDPASRIIGDSIKLKQGSAVFDVYYNHLSGIGSVQGEEFTPIEIPVGVAFPDVPGFSTGTQDFDVPQDASQTIAEGSYGLLKARQGSTITFTGGVYSFTEWDVGLDVTLDFEAPSEIYIAGKLMVDQGSYVGPSASATGLDARDIVIYVTGSNGENGGIGETPKAAKFGIDVTLIANVYVPNGTLWIRQNSSATGAFLARWVTVGIGVTVDHQSRW